VRPAGTDELRTRWELKNMNSFSFIARGIEAAVREQIALHEAGEEIVQQTYDYDADADALTPHRAKEEADDYRYFPEPDLVPVEPERELVEHLSSELPEPPGARIRRLEEVLGFDTAWELVTTGRDAEYGKLAGAGVEARVAANVVRNEAAGISIAEPEELAKVIEARAELPREVYLDAVAASGSPGFSAAASLAQRAVADTSELEPIVERILSANPDQVAAYRGGKEGLLGFFVGQVMKETNGKANPKVVNELVREKLAADD
jgi:aspartyl-tRNA(Asn)/glutamyl-tRNA(Gln) amidotransferase subunit B